MAAHFRAEFGLAQRDSTCFHEGTERSSRTNQQIVNCSLEMEAPQTRLGGAPVKPLPVTLLSGFLVEPTVREACVHRC